MTESGPTGNNGLTTPNYMCECNGEWHLKGSHQCAYIYKRDNQSNSTFTEHYTSIPCIHADHNDCGGSFNQECPYCEEPCKCACHQDQCLCDTDGEWHKRGDGQCEHRPALDMETITGANGRTMAQILSDESPYGEGPGQAPGPNAWD